MITRLKIILFVFMFLRGVVALGQNLDAVINAQLKSELQIVGPLMKATHFIYEGKLKDALNALAPYADSLKKISADNWSAKNKYLLLLQNEARLNGAIGDFTTEEQQLKEAFQIASADKTGMETGMVREVLNNLSQLYREVNNTGAVREILEKLVVMEYGHGAADKKARFFEYFQNISKIFDTRSKSYLATMMQMPIDTSRLDTALQILRKLYTSYVKVILRNGADSAETDGPIADLWEEYNRPHTAPDTGDAGQFRQVFDALISMQFSSALTAGSPATGIKTGWLRTGSLQFSGKRNGVIPAEPWNEVQRLFQIYVNDENYQAAEALIKQAIRTDEAPTAVEKDSSLNIIAPFMQQALQQLATNYGANQSIVDNAVRLLSVGGRQKSTDVFYLQNKILLAGLYRKTGHETDWKLLRDMVYRLCNQLDTTSNPIVSLELGDIYAACEKFNDAAKDYRKVADYYGGSAPASTVFASIYMRSVQSLARVYKITGQFDEAIAVLKTALDYDNKISAEKTPDHSARLMELASVYENMGQYDMAEKYSAEALSDKITSLVNNFSFLSEREKIMFINSQVSAFDFSASILKTNPARSMVFTEAVLNQELLIKNLALNDERHMLTAVRKKAGANLIRLFDSWLDNRAAIAWQVSRPVSPLSRHLADSLGEIANTQEEEINRMSKVLRPNEQRHDFNTLRHKLKVGEAGVEFVRFKEYKNNWTGTVWYACFIICPNKRTAEFIPLCKENELEALLARRSFYNFYSSRTKKHGTLPGDTLYKLIWKPIEPYLSGCKMVAIAPSGLLNRVAFLALPRGENQFLDDKYQIRQYASLGEMIEKQEKKSVFANAALFGGIDYNCRIDTEITGRKTPFGLNQRSGEQNDRLDSLPGTLNEISQIARLLRRHGKKVSLFSGVLANERSFKHLSGVSPAVLHIATHGFWLANPQASTNNEVIPRDNVSLREDPMFRSGIMMACANKVWTGAEPAHSPDDGIVSAYEISNLDLSNTRLIVLSACETALGDITSTEGVFGLQRALKIAGVKNMILSLWPVADKQTSQLMTIFYSEKLKGVPDYIALKRARQVLRKKYPPNYWAAFELIE